MVKKQEMSAKALKRSGDLMWNLKYSENVLKYSKYKAGNQGS